MVTYPTECPGLAKRRHSRSVNGLRTFAHCDAVGWEASTASEPDIRTFAPQVDFGLMMVSVEQYTRKMPQLIDSRKGALFNHKY
jgi:hypothetical protein